MKKLFILLLITATIISCKKKNVWTKGYEKQVYATVYDGLGSIMRDSTQRKDFTLYMVDKLKTTLPAGIESIPGDSLKKLSAKISSAYEASHKKTAFKAVIPWSKDTEMAIRNSMEKRMVDKFTQQSQDKYCDCVIAKLKTMYPDSLIMPLSDSTTTAINTGCVLLLVKK